MSLLAARCPTALAIRLAELLAAASDGDDAALHRRITGALRSMRGPLRRDVGSVSELIGVEPQPAGSA
jgi:hypothetical protein